MTSPPIKLIQTRHGPMRAFAGDTYITRCLEEVGEYSRAEWELLAQLIRPGMNVVEAGANIGAHTIPIGRSCAPGKLYAFEPVAETFDLLRVNVTANDLPNVLPVHAALGAQCGTTFVRPVDFFRPANFGAISIADTGIPVRQCTVDELDLPALGLIKIDVEGCELDVIEGARATIERCRPTLYCENDRAVSQGDLIDAIASRRYRLYWHTPLLAEMRTSGHGEPWLFGAPVRSLNMLCIPAERGTTVQGLVEIDPKNWNSPLRAMT